MSSIKYEYIRSDIKTGDCILWKGKSFISRAIMKFTEFSHVSLVVRLKRYEQLRDRVFLVEAMPKGLELNLLSFRLKDYRGRVYYLPTDLNDEQRVKILGSAIVDVTKHIKYDYKSLFKNIFGRVSVDARRLFCSEYGYIKLASVGGIPKKEKAPRPGDFPMLTGTKPVEFVL